MSKGLGFNPIRSTPPCSQWYNIYAVWNIKTQIHTNTNKSTYSEIGQVRQDPKYRYVRPQTRWLQTCVRWGCSEVGYTELLQWSAGVALFSVAWRHWRHFRFGGRRGGGSDGVIGCCRTLLWRQSLLGNRCTSTNNHQKMKLNKRCTK